MRFAKAAALVVAFVAAVAVGIWIGPYITERRAPVADTIASATPSPEATVERSQPARNGQRSAAVHRAKAKMRTVAAPAPEPAEDGITAKALPAAAPALHERVKAVLNKGADMGIASQDFNSAEQFVAVAHAARNTKVPFMVLKHRVVYEGKSLEAAIREFKPDLNAAAEAARARAEAKSMIAELAG